jgi:hypothetical protein
VTHAFILRANSGARPNNPGPYSFLPCASHTLRQALSRLEESAWNAHKNAFAHAPLYPRRADACARLAANALVKNDFALN